MVNYYGEVPTCSGSVLCNYNQLLYACLSLWDNSSLRLMCLLDALVTVSVQTLIYQWQSCDFIAILCWLTFWDSAELDHTCLSKEAKCQ